MIGATAPNPLRRDLADRMPRHKTLLYAVLVVYLIVLLLAPAFHAIRTWPSIWTVVLVVFVLIGLTMLWSPVGFVLILETFKPEVRTVWIEQSLHPVPDGSPRDAQNRHRRKCAAPQR